LVNTKLILEEGAHDGAIRVDRAWDLFFESNPTIPKGHGGRLIQFTNWLWEELGKKAGNLNKNAKSELTLTIPTLSQGHSTSCCESGPSGPTKSV